MLLVKEFYMRGSIAWPEGKQEGFALMAGLDLVTGTVIVFEQFKYWTVSHWLHDGGTIQERSDGGYYLLGMRAPGARLFEGIEWSSERVLAQTEALVAAQELAMAYLPEQFDIDTAEEFERWQRQMHRRVQTQM